MYSVSVLGVVLSVVNVDSSSLKSSTSNGAVFPGSDGILLNKCSSFCGKIVRGDNSNQLAIETPYGRMFGRAQLNRICSERLEDWLEIECGNANHLKQLAGRRLLLECDRELARSRLLGFERPCVLDGDDGGTSSICRSVKGYTTLR